MPVVTMRQLLDEAAAGGYGMLAAAETHSGDKPGNGNPRGPGTASPAAMKEACAPRELGMAGHAGDEPLSLEDMKARHASGLRAAA